MTPNPISFLGVRRWIAAAAVAVWAGSGARLRADGPPTPPTGTAPIVRFVQITDTHHGAPLHQLRLEQAIERINALPFPIAFVVHTGDLASDNLANPGVAAAVSNTLSRLKAPLVVLPGNHDILPQKRDETLAAYRTHFGPLATRLETDGIVLLALYTEPLRRSVSIPGYDPIAWLEEQLASSAGRPVIVAHHAPDAQDFYNNSIHDGWPAEARQRWGAALAKGHVVGVLCGHFHRDEVHWSSQGVPTYVASSVAGFWGRQGSFRIYTHENGRLSYRTVYLDDPTP